MVTGSGPTVVVVQARGVVVGAAVHCEWMERAAATPAGPDSLAFTLTPALAIIRA